MATEQENKGRTTDGKKGQVMTEIKLTKRYPHSRTEDITDAFMRGYEQGKKDGLKVGKQIVLGAFETYITADRKTENSSEKPNNCEPQTIRCPKCGRTDYIRDMEKDMGIKDSHYKYKCINCNTYIKDEPTISKMEQVAKDINVRSKTEPQTECGDFADRLAYERGVKHAWEVAQKVFDSTVTFYEAEDVAKQIAKDEPQTLDDIGKQIQDAYDKGIISDADATQAWYEAVNKTEPQIERSE